MDKFAGYGFVKPHSTCYALVAFQTAYLKRHFPAEFMAASISSEMGSSARVVILIEECKRMGINVKPPDVNESFYEFKVEGYEIRFGLGAIKNVGRGAIESIVASREEEGPYQNVFQFCERIDSRLANKKVLESLAQSGALDSLEGNRAQKMAVIETAIAFAASVNADKLRGQTSIFGGEEGGEEIERPPLPFIEDLDNSEKLALEKEMLGFYVSGHPLDRFRQEAKAFATTTLDMLNEQKDGAEVRICGILTECKSILDKKNKPMAFITVEDFLGNAEIIVFSSVFEKYREELQVDQMVVVAGRKSSKDEENAKILCDKVILIEEAWEEYGKNLCLSMNVIGVDDPLLSEVTEILRQNPGPCNLYIDLHTSEKSKRTIKSTNLKVKPSVNMLTKLRDLLGQENVWMEG